MKAVGIICEYNPFHNGHLYHLKKTKELYPNHTIICVMSSSFMQRGEPSIINKWDKTKIALHYGIDLVIELPFIFSSQSADTFAKGSIEILKHLKVNTIVFGSESNDIEHLINIADLTLDNRVYDDLVSKYMKEGLSYPSATNKALEDITDNSIKTPNDLLALAYIREITKQKAKIKPISIKRTNDYHSKKLNKKIVSASSIREGLKNNKKVNKFVPREIRKYLSNDIVTIDDYFEYLKHKILVSSKKELLNIQGVNEGIENRIKKYINQSNNYKELLENIKTNRYTYSKIKRMLTHILTGFTKKEAKDNNKVKYIRLLGFNNKGQKHLNSIKKNIKVPILSKYSKLLDLEQRITNIYSLIYIDEDRKLLITSEYKNNPIKN